MDRQVTLMVTPDNAVEIVNGLIDIICDKNDGELAGRLKRLVEYHGGMMSYAIQSTGEVASSKHSDSNESLEKAFDRDFDMDNIRTISVKGIRISYIK